MALAVPAGPVAATPRNRDADRALAQHAVLSPSDLPGEWQESTASPFQAMGRAATRLAPCRPFVRLNTAMRAEPSSASHQYEAFVSTVANTVTVFATVQAAGAAFRHFNQSSLPKCLEQVLTKGLTGSHARVDSVRADRMAVDPIGDRTTAYRILLSYKARELPHLSLTVSVHLVQVGRALATFSFVEIGEPLRSTLVRDVVGRL
jgi:hypothetical protein